MPLVSAHVAFSRANARPGGLRQQVNLCLGTQQLDEVIVETSANAKLKGRRVEGNARFDVGHIDIQNEAGHSFSLVQS